MSHSGVIIFGEVLFDIFPDGSRTLGGAPFNVAWHLRAFGLDPLVITRIGDDADGREVRSAMADWGLDTSGLQSDPDLPTGKVVIRFEAGEPQYTILHPAAFDAIDYPQAVSASGDRIGMLYHGSLALRSAASRNSLEKLRSRSPGTTFLDVNLRPPWWKRCELLDWIGAADWVKLNGHELRQLSGDGGAALDQAVGMLNDYGLVGLILTRGEAGANLLTADRTDCRVRPRDDARLVDSVGAGDAFTAVMLLGLLQNWPHQDTLRRAQEFASAICGQRGATVRDMNFYSLLLERWKLTN